VHSALWKPARPAGERSRLARFFSSVTFCCALLLACTAPQAKADFSGYYAIANFNTIQSTFANGFVYSATNSNVVFWGPNDGNGVVGGETDFTIAAKANGLFQFSWTFSTQDAPGFEDAGYLVNGVFTKLSYTSGDYGSVVVPVLAGEIIGFGLQTADNTGGPGVLTVNNFSGPLSSSSSAPEPGTFKLLLVGAAAAIVARRQWRIRSPRRSKTGIVAVAVAAIFFIVPIRAQTQHTYTGSNVTGQLVFQYVVNASQAAPPPAGAQTLLQSAFAAKELFRAPRPRPRPPIAPAGLHPEMAAAAAAGLGATLVVQPLTLAPLSGTTGFNALSQRDQKNADGGDQYTVEPPNASVAVGNGYVLEGVNDAVEVFNTSGSPALPIVISANQLFGLEPQIYDNGINGPFLTDMRVYYDSGTNLWFVLMRAHDEDASGDEIDSSHLYLAASQSGNPTGNYNIYFMITTNASHSGCPCFPDFPQIGSDQYGIHISWNEYNANPNYVSPPFVDAAILSISKTSLADGAASPTAFQVFIPFFTGFEFAIQPATTPPGAVNFLGNGGQEYFASTAIESVATNAVALWAMTNTSSLATGSPNLTLSMVLIPTLPYYTPTPATQKPGPTPLGTSVGDPLEYLDGGLDNRVQGLTYSTGRLYLTFQTGVSDVNGVYVDGGAYVVLSPTFRNGTLAAQVLNEGYLLLSGNHLLRPSIAVNSQPIPTGAIAVTLTGPNYYPSAALIPFQTFNTPTTIEIAAPGALPEDGFTGYPAIPASGGSSVARWGDYNTAVAASDGSIWAVVEYIGNFARTTYANWNTYIMRNQP